MRSAGNPLSTDCVQRLYYWHKAIQGPESPSISIALQRKPIRERTETNCLCAPQQPGKAWLRLHGQSICALKARILRPPPSAALPNTCAHNSRLLADGRRGSLAVRSSAGWRVHTIPSEQQACSAPAPFGLQSQSGIIPHVQFFLSADNSMFREFQRTPRRHLEITARDNSRNHPRKMAITPRVAAQGAPIRFLERNLLQYRGVSRVCSCGKSDV